jgi:hypothetical protein
LGEDELKHAMEEHFSMLPIDILLELIERILRDPTKISNKRSLTYITCFIDLTTGNI